MCSQWLMVEISWCLRKTTNKPTYNKSNQGKNHPQNIYFAKQYTVKILNSTRIAMTKKVDSMNLSEPGILLLLPAGP